MSDTKGFNRHFAGLLKDYATMTITEFLKIDKNNLTVEESIAYYYVSESSINTKTADKVIELIKWYESDSQWFVN